MTSEETGAVGGSLRKGGSKHVLFKEDQDDNQKQQQEKPQQDMSSVSTTSYSSSSVGTNDEVPTPPPPPPPSPLVADARFEHVDPIQCYRSGCQGECRGFSKVGTKDADRECVTLVKESEFEHVDPIRCYRNGCVGQCRGVRIIDEMGIPLDRKKRMKKWKKEARKNRAKRKEEKNKKKDSKSVDEYGEANDTGNSSKKGNADDSHDYSGRPESDTSLSSTMCSTVVESTLNGGDDFDSDDSDDFLLKSWTSDKFSSSGGFCSAADSDEFSQPELDVLEEEGDNSVISAEEEEEEPRHNDKEITRQSAPQQEYDSTTVDDDDDDDEDDDDEDDDDDDEDDDDDDDVGANVYEVVMTMVEDTKANRRGVNIPRHMKRVLKCCKLLYTAVAGPDQQSVVEEDEDSDDDSVWSDDSDYDPYEPHDPEPKSKPKKRRINVDSHLTAAEYLFQQFVILHPDMEKRFSDLSRTKFWYAVLELVEQYLHEKLRALYSGNVIVDEQGNVLVDEQGTAESSVRNDLSLGETSAAIGWIDKFNKEMKDLALDSSVSDTDTPLCSEFWTGDRKILFQHYLDNCVRRDVRKMMGQSFNLRFNDETRMLDDGILITDFPENVMFIMKQQVETSRDILPQDMHEPVLHGCNEEVRSFFAGMLDEVDDQCQGLRTSRFCTMINDYFRLSDLLADFNDEYAVSDDTNAADEACMALAQIGMAVTKRLCDKIVRDLCKEEDPLLSTIGAASWETPAGQTVVERVIGTYDDYFKDLEEWLTSGYVYPKVLKNVFDANMRVYMEFFFKNTQSRDMEGSALMAKQLRDDHRRLFDFFTNEDLSEFHGVAGFYSEKVLEDRLKVIAGIAGLVDTDSDLEDAADAVMEVLEQLRCGEDGDTGIPALVHLVGLRRTPSCEETEKLLLAVAEAEEMIEYERARKEISPKPRYIVPDVGCSKHARCLVVDSSSFPDKMSSKQLKYIDAALSHIEQNQQNRLLLDATDMISSLYHSTEGMVVDLVDPNSVLPVLTEVPSAAVTSLYDVNDALFSSLG